MTPDQVKLVQQSFAQVVPISEPAHYSVVGSALLWTLEKGLGEAWTPDVTAAWTAAYGTLSGYMISKAYGSAQAAE